MEPSLSLHHHWDNDDSIDETFRETLMGNDLDNTGYFFHDLWFGDMGNLFHVC